MTSDTQSLGAPTARRGKARRHRFRINGYFFFLFPGVAIVLAMTLFPALYGIYMSFTNLNLGYVGSSFVGLENYVRFFTWSDLGLITRNTFVFVTACVVLQACIGLAVAILLNPLVGVMHLRDDHADSPVLAAMLDDDLRAQLAKTPTADDVSRIQLAAIGVPADGLGDYLAHLASIAKEDPGGNGEFRAERSSPCEVIWGNGRPLRTIRGWQSSFDVRCDSRLRRLYLRDGDGIMGVDLRECTTSTDRGRREVPADWVANPDESVDVRWMGYSAHPPRVVGRTTHPGRETDHEDPPVVEDGQNVAAEVVERIAHANPHTGGRYWSLTVRLTTPDHAHFMSVGVLVPITCPCPDPFEPIRPGDTVELYQTSWVAEVSPSIPFQIPAGPSADTPEDQ
jgi:hypothetical protein